MVGEDNCSSMNHQVVSSLEVVVIGKHKEVGVMEMEEVEVVTCICKEVVEMLMVEEGNYSGREVVERERVVEVEVEVVN